jgi:hypothetical protein
MNNRFAYFLANLLKYRTVIEYLCECQKKCLNYVFLALLALICMWVLSLSPLCSQVSQFIYFYFFAYSVKREAVDLCVFGKGVVISRVSKCVNREDNKDILIKKKRKNRMSVEQSPT